MLQGPGASVAQAARFGQAPHATTLSGSAGMMQARSTRRYAVGGLAVVVAAVVAVAVVARVASQAGSDAGSGGSAIAVTAPVVGSGGPGTIDAAETVQGAGLPRDAGEVVVATVVDAAAVPTGSEAPAVEAAGAARKAGDAKATAAHCAELEVNQKWQDLHDCAGELAGIAAKDRSVAPKAEEFRQKAVKETNSSLAATKLKDALLEGNLREAQKQLKAIGPDWFYSSAASEAFHAAEAKAVDENRRKALALAAKNDCAGVKRLQAQVNATSTTAVSSAVAAVAAKCMDRVDPQSVDQSQGQLHALAASKSSCDTTKADDAMTQAHNQYVAGFYKVALLLATRALLCKQDVQMYRLAATYACAAHDVTAAKQLLNKVPAQFQSGIIQRCC